MELRKLVRSNEVLRMTASEIFAKYPAFSSVIKLEEFCGHLGHEKRRVKKYYDNGAYLAHLDGPLRAPIPRYNNKTKKFK